MEDDDDSSADSDYCPGQDEGSDVESQKSDEKDSKLTDMTHGRKRKADLLWQELLENDEKETQSKMAKSIVGKPAKKEGKKKKLKVSADYKSMLAAVFGDSRSAKSALSKTRTAEDGRLPSEDIKQASLLAAKSILKKTSVTETSKFAGKEVKVKKTVLGNNSTAVAPKAPTNSLDAVLDNIKGPKTISTVTKSSVDWDSFKEEEGLDDALMHAGKDGFLARKDFLERCDYRAFEKERDVRLQQAATRGELK